MLISVYGYTAHNKPYITFWRFQSSLSQLQGVLQYGMLIYRFISKLGFLGIFRFWGWYQLAWRIWQCLMSESWRRNHFQPVWTAPASVRCCWCAKPLVMCVPGSPKLMAYMNCMKRYSLSWTLMSTFPGLCFQYGLNLLVIYYWSPFCWNCHWSGNLTL